MMRRSSQRGGGNAPPPRNQGGNYKRTVSNNNDQIITTSFNGSQNNAEYARIQVVVRVRPLNAVEISRKKKIILQPDGDQKLVVWDPACFDSMSESDLDSIDPSCWSRDFAFDRCLWSIDEEDEDYASQDTVYEVVGEPVLKWTMAGYNSCIFAFGQTGAGKSHTMMGKVRGNSARQYGLIPRICFGIFDHLESVCNSPTNVVTEGSDSVTFSHLEIYNENVRDLLAPEKSSTLKIREHPKTGVFVANLTTVNVTTFEEVMSLIAIGDRNRTVAATNSNIHSSRSHAIVTLTVCQRNISTPKHQGVPTSGLQNKIGKVHLVDLAGSERAALSGAKDTRLKEANNINKSLSVLGDVIKSLGDVRSATLRKDPNSTHSLGVHIPYRNSALTMVLKDSLGGNAHAVMITAVSPCASDYEETLSTLKYADRAKKVRMRVEANVSSGLLASDSNSAAYLVPLLKAEVKKLKEMLQQQQEEHKQMLKMQNENRNYGSMRNATVTVAPIRSTGNNDVVNNYQHQFSYDGNGRTINNQHMFDGYSSNIGRDSMNVDHRGAQSNSFPNVVSNRQSGGDGRLRESGTENMGDMNGTGTGVGDGSDAGLAMSGMQTRVMELEKQLQERESLIDSLNTVQEQPTSATVAMPLNTPQHSGNRAVLSPRLRSSVLNNPDTHNTYNWSDDPNISRSGNQDISQDYSVTGPNSSQQAVNEPPDNKGANNTRKYQSSLGMRNSNLTSSKNNPTSSTVNSNSNGISNGLPIAPSVPQGVVVISDAEDSNVDKNMPRLVNLNQDPLFSECVMYYLPEGRTTVGSSPEECDILISGLDIKRKHCVIYNKRGIIWVEPIENAIVFVNGEIFLSREAQIEFKEQVQKNKLIEMEESNATVTGETTVSAENAVRKKGNDTLGNILRYSFDETNASSSSASNSNANNIMTGRVLSNGNRISFGRYHLFRYVHQSSPDSAPAGGSNHSTKGWEEAHEELMGKNDSIMRLRSSVSLDAKTLVHQYLLPPAVAALGQQDSDGVDANAGIDMVSTAAAAVSSAGVSIFSGQGRDVKEYLVDDSHSNAKSVRFSQNLEEFQNFPGDVAEETKRGSSSQNKIDSRAGFGAGLAGNTKSSGAVLSEEKAPPPPPLDSVPTLHRSASPPPPPPPPATGHITTGGLPTQPVMPAQVNTLATPVRPATEKPTPISTPAPSTSISRAMPLTPLSPYSNDLWWERLQRVADGSENANPTELRDMLKLLLTKAEENVGSRKTRTGLTPTNISNQQNARLNAAAPVSTAVSEGIKGNGSSDRDGIAVSMESKQRGSTVNYMDSNPRKTTIAPNDKPQSPKDKFPISAVTSSLGLKAYDSTSIAVSKNIINSSQPSAVSTVDNNSATNKNYASNNTVNNKDFTKPYTTSIDGAARVVGTTEGRSNGSAADGVSLMDAKPANQAPSSPVSKGGPIGNKNAMMSPNSFEKEALALQSELALMQKTLQNRMQRYSDITATAPSAARNVTISGAESGSNVESRTNISSVAPMPALSGVAGTNFKQMDTTYNQSLLRKSDDNMSGPDRNIDRVPNMSNAYSTMNRFSAGQDFNRSNLERSIDNSRHQSNPITYGNSTSISDANKTYNYYASRPLIPSSSSSTTRSNSTSNYVTTLGSNRNPYLNMAGSGINGNPNMSNLNTSNRRYGSSNTGYHSTYNPNPINNNGEYKV